MSGRDIWRMWSIDFSELTDYQIKEFAEEDGIDNSQFYSQPEKIEGPPVKILILSSPPEDDGLNGYDLTWFPFVNRLFEKLREASGSDILADSFFPTLFDLIIAQGLAASLVALFPLACFLRRDFILRWSKKSILDKIMALDLGEPLHHTMCPVIIPMFNDSDGVVKLFSNYGQENMDVINAASFCEIFKPYAPQAHDHSYISWERKAVKLATIEARRKYPNRGLGFVVQVSSQHSHLRNLKQFVFQKEAEFFKQSRTGYELRYPWMDSQFTTLRDMMDRPRMVSAIHQRPLRLLSLDGGGMRGLSSLIILKRLMETLYDKGIISRATRPGDYFDMIGGTSTGGLIAILLGRLKMTVEECIEEYENLGKEIFGKGKAFQKATAFSATHFEFIIREIVKRRAGSQEAELWYEVEKKDKYGKATGIFETSLTPIFVVAVNKERASSPSGVALFRSYPRDESATYPKRDRITIWQAARATAAAPTYFKAQRILNEDYVDGGLGHNCPALHLIEEAERFYKNSEIGCLVSIGTGVEQGVKLAAEGTLTTNMSKVPFVGGVAAKIDAALVTKAITTSSEHIHRFVEARFRDRGCPDVYYRFSVTVGLDVRLHEYQKIPLIREATEKYLIEPKTKRTIEAWARKSFTLDLPQNQVFKKQRRHFSEPDDIESVVEASAGVTKDLLLKLHQVPAEASVTVLLSPESLWPKKRFFEGISIHDVALDSSDTSPTGELIFEFLLNPQEKDSRESYSTCQQFRHLTIDGKVGPGPWRVCLVFAVQSSKLGKPTTESDAGMLNLLRKVTVELRVYVASAADEFKSGPPFTSITLSCDTASSSTGWQELASTSEEELLNLSSGQLVMFELVLSLDTPVDHERSIGDKNPLNEERVRVLFGGIRLVAAD